MRPVRGGMSLASAAREERTARTTRTGRTKRATLESWRFISVLLPPQLVAQLVAVTGPDLDVVAREYLAALPDGLHQGGPRPAMPNLRGQPPGDALPLSLLDLLMNARVGQQDHPSLEERDEEEDARPILGVEDLLSQEGHGGPAAHSRVQNVLTGQPTADGREKSRDEKGRGTADRRRQGDPVGQRNAPDGCPAVDGEGDQRREQRSQGRALPGRRGVLVALVHHIGDDLAGRPRLRLAHRGADGLEVGLAEEAVGFHFDFASRGILYQGDLRRSFVGNRRRPVPL